MNPPIFVHRKAIRALSDLQAQEIKGMLWQGYRANHIMKAYPCSSRMVQDILAGRSYTDIPWQDGTYGPMPDYKKREHVQARTVVRGFGTAGAGPLSKISMGLLSEKDQHIKRLMDSDPDITYEWALKNWNLEQQVILDAQQKNREKEEKDRAAYRVRQEEYEKSYTPEQVLLFEEWKEGLRPSAAARNKENQRISGLARQRAEEFNIDIAEALEQVKEEEKEKTEQLMRDMSVDLGASPQDDAGQQE